MVKSKQLTEVYKVKASSLYTEVVEVTSKYLGTSADRFVSKQVVGHLNKAPERLLKSDLKELIKWIKPTMALLTDDIDMVDKYIDKLRQLIVPGTISKED